jgi:predicted LPLAT superfamily acyltransferase
VADRAGGWSGRSRGGGFGYRFFIFLIRRAGVGFAYRFLSVVVPYFVVFAPRSTAAAWFYWRRVMGRRVFSALGALFVHYYRFGQTLIDKIAISAGMGNRYRFEFDNYDEFLKILDSGSGVVIIGAHAGNWEAGSSFFGDYARRMNVVLYDAEHEKIKRAMRSASAGAGVKVIAVNDDGIENILKIKNALDAGEYVCFQGDRYVGGHNAVVVDFMGRRARIPRGPCLVASRMRVPVVFFYAMREPGRTYRFHFVEAAGRTEKELRDEYLSVTKNIVERYPHQWFNFYKFWD